MKIALFSQFYFPSISGVVIALDNLCQGLQEFGHQIYIVAPQAKKFNYPRNRTIIPFPSINIPVKDLSFPLSLTITPKVFRQLKKLDLDLIHTHHPFYVGETALFYAKKLKIPLVATFHTQYDEYVSTYLPFLPQKITREKINQYVCDFMSRCNGVIIPTKAIKRKYLKKTRVSQAIIPSGIDISRFQKKQPSIRKKLGLKPKETALMTVSRLAKEKNIDFLIEAFSIICQREENVKLIIVGGGLYQGTIKRIVQESGLSQKVILTGNIEPRKINQYYQSADIFVYSCLTDTQGLTLIEAMASGLPIVAVSSPERRELVKNKKEAIFTANRQVAFANQVIKLIKNPKQRLKLSKAAGIGASRFSYQKTAKQTLDFYQKIIKSCQKTTADTGGRKRFLGRRV